MTKLPGPGPVFAFERLMTARRWQTYAMRSTTVALLLTAMWFVWQDYAGNTPTGELAIAQYVEVGKTFFATTAIILLGLVGLAAPAAAAGSICLDKSRGNLTLLFVTDLSDAEIVLGKLAARLMPVLGLILGAAPVLSIAMLFGGVSPVGLAGALLVILSCAIFGCSLALTLSVWGQKTHEVLLATYVFGIFYLLASPIVAVLQSAMPAAWPWWFPTYTDLFKYNPVFLVLAAVEGPPPGLPPVTFGMQASFLALGLAASAALVSLAIWRIRRVAIRELGQGELGPHWRLLRFQQLYRSYVPGPSLDNNPVLWRESHRKRPSRWGILLWGAYILLWGSLSLYAIGLMIDGQFNGRELGTAVNVMQVASGLLLLSVSAATSLAEERQRGGLDVLMATPLSTRSIVWGKWWGVFRTTPRLLILPSLLTFALSCHTGHLWGVAVMAALILSYAATITSLGLALATWMPQLGRAVGMTVGMYVVGGISWLPVSFSLFGNAPGNVGTGIAAGSPLMGVGFFGALLSGDGLRNELLSQTAWTIFWILAHSSLSLILLLATLATFNRCLGRIDPPRLLEDDANQPSTGQAGRFGESPRS